MQSNGVSAVIDPLRQAGPERPRKGLSNPPITTVKATTTVSSINVALLRRKHPVATAGQGYDGA